MPDSFTYSGFVELGDIKLRFDFNKTKWDKTLSIRIDYTDRHGDRASRVFVPNHVPVKKEDLDRVLENLYEMVTEEEAETLFSNFLAELKRLSSTEVEFGPNFFQET